MKWTPLTGIDSYVEGTTLRQAIKDRIKEETMKPNKYYKTVLLPIQVCTGDYCWNMENRVCGFFDNEGGHGHCDLNIDTLKRDKKGLYPKPEKCLKLKEL